MGGRGTYVFHEHVIVVVRFRTWIIWPQLSELFFTPDRGLRFQSSRTVDQLWGECGRRGVGMSD